MHSCSNSIQSLDRQNQSCSDLAGPTEIAKTWRSKIYGTMCYLPQNWGPGEPMQSVDALFMQTHFRNPIHQEKFASKDKDPKIE
ncbi:hypothetical protein C1752_00438 [Acaryochloris thomasi RCC1774]|uniref:Uncharacterized protein n=1 Tax=Acaryochloris thomasi RCC1774 TaxID=1764569 RepID=A0A2W1K7R2_9CYAN|nr:hypothetical protein C1752_00438 [Acaryochloris thomasi RCC1774]